MQLNTHISQVSCYSASNQLWKLEPFDTSSKKIELEGWLNPQSATPLSKEQGLQDGCLHFLAKLCEQFNMLSGVTVDCLAFSFKLFSNNFVHHPTLVNFGVEDGL